MIKYQIIYLNYLQTNIIPFTQKHYVYLLKNRKTYEVWRGQKELLKKILSAECAAGEVVSITVIDCVWDLNCTTKHLIEVICTKVYDLSYIDEIMYMEQNRVINYEQKYVDKFVVKHCDDNETQ
ncbi:Maph36 [Matsumuraeses phaseoli granulovirus]|uniref:Maph36 n=1 Tax=Matsumuraeses phaseoli granulovirus TaxID=2760664 RepID=A0AAE7SXN0_9BBAC|nr:Maph36 [Matsumuraeses phaseoli granulovirus]QOD39999.1 Maph36 [Matsumuraeses phaseoli granulovirus]